LPLTIIIYIIFDQCDPALVQLNARPLDSAPAPPLGGHVINTLGPRRLLKCEEQKYSYAPFGRLSKRKFQSRPLTFYGANSVAIANCTKIMTGTVCIFATHFWIFWIGLHLRDSRNKSPFFSLPSLKKGAGKFSGGRW